MADWSYWIGIAATVAFAVTAVLAVKPLGIDFFGASVLGIITAIGGGTIRDLILGVPVFWAGDLSYIWAALISSLLAFRVGALFTQRRVNSLLLYLDGFGAALFGIEAVDKVWNLKFALPLGPIILGIITAIGGGLIRDVLADRKTLLMSRDIYAIPVMLGCALYVLTLKYFPDYGTLGAIAGISLSFGIRAAAIHWNLEVPGWLATEQKEG